MDESPNEPEFSAEEWETVKELVFQWDTTRPEDLEAWLSDCCPSGPIQREVERLVRAAAQSDHFMKGKATEEHFGVVARHPVHIGRYRVIEELGAGGLGVVYAAYDPALERKVAIKILAESGSAGAEHGKRLRWDAKAASTVKHPNIVVVHDIGSESGADFIVMECVEGQPLGTLIGGTPLLAQKALKYAIQIAYALEAAHKAGITHRDLKPNNVMITDADEVKLLDFGLAKHDDASVEHTSLPATIEGHFAGTASYVSPEQAEGKPVDHRGDIFAFGCILFEMLTGKQAFPGTSLISVIGSILHKPAPSLRQAAPQLDERYEPIIDRCLRKDPAERFATISEVIPCLGELIETDASPSRFSYRTRKRLTHWAVAAAIAIFLGVLAIAAMNLSPKPLPPHFARVDPYQITSGLGLSSYPAISRDGKWLAYASDQAGKGNLDIWVQHWGQVDAKPLTSGPGDEYDPSFSADGSRVIYRSDRDGGGLYSVSVLGGDPVLVARKGRDGRYSPEGRWLAYWTGEVGRALKAGTARILIVPAAGGRAEELLQGFDVAAYPVWSATGEQVIFLGRRTGDAKGDWWVMEMKDKTVHPTGLLETFRKSVPKEPARAYYPTPRAWLPDQTVLFSGLTLDATNIWAVRVDPNGKALEEPHRWTDGTEVEDYPDAIASAHSVHAVYAALKMSSALYRIPLNSNGVAQGPPEVLVDGSNGLSSPSLNRDGTKLAYLTRSPGDDVIELADLTGKRTGIASQIYMSNGILRSILSGNGNFIAWGFDKKGYIMPVKGADPEEVCHDCGLASDLTFDGQRAIFEGSKSDELVLCVRGQKARPLFHWEHASWTQAAGRFSPDERLVVFSGQKTGESAKEVLIAPVTPDGGVNDSQIVAITNDEYSNIEPVWSPDGGRVYYLSNCEGPLGIWARDVDPRSGRPLRPAYVVSRFDYAGLTVHGPISSPQTIGLSATKTFLVLTLMRTTGNVWARQIFP